MKTKFYLFAIFTATILGQAIAQNLKPDLALTRTITVPPMKTDYIAFTKIYVLPKFFDGQNISPDIANQVNTNVYSLEAGIETAEMYFTSEVYRTWKKNATSSESTSTTKDKQGNPVTVTTYKYDSEEELRFELNLFLANGTRIAMNSSREKVQVSGTSTSSYQSAYNDYTNNRRTKTTEALRKLIPDVYSKIANEYLFTQTSVSLFSIGVKSRKVDYADMNQASQYMQQWLSANPSDLTSADVIEANKIYDMVLMEHEPDNKKARVDNEIAAVCYYAKACMEFATSNYRKAEEYILKSEALDPRIHYSQEGMKNTLKLLKDRRVYN